MIDTTLDFSVVICAYTEERWNDLVAAVESIQQQSTSPREIIVVIDNNTDLLEKVRVHLSNVIAIENSEPRGLSGARNSGIAIAQGKFIAFLDDDAIAEPDWLTKLGYCLADSRVLGVGGTVKPIWLSKRPTWFPEEFFWIVGCSYRGLPAVQTIVRNPYGGCTCIRREVFEIVGGFRNGIGRAGAYPMGGEETELCIRAKHQWPEKIFLYEPRAKIHHRIPSYRTGWSYFRSRCYAEGLSKVIIAQYVGARDSLASERSYALCTLPSGVLHGVMDALFRFDLTGSLRAGAIVTGLMITTAGYIVGAISQRLALCKGVNTSDCYNFKQLQHQIADAGMPKR
jgi:glycosyltransferase involved in cell wall biosynthesis